MPKYRARREIKLRLVSAGAELQVPFREYVPAGRKSPWAKRGRVVNMRRASVKGQGTKAAVGSDKTTSALQSDNKHDKHA